MPNEAAIQPRKEPVQDRSRKKFERILHEATLLMDAKGVDAVAMSEVAEKSEISIASLYQYFPDKAAIVATLAQRMFAEGQTAMQVIWNQAEDREKFIGAVTYMIDCYLDSFCEVPGAFSIWQGTQADKRLQFLDEQDCNAHATMFHDALIRVAPETAPQAAGYSKSMAVLIAAAVRHAAIEEREAGRAQIQVFKEMFILPSLAALFQRHAPDASSEDASPDSSPE